MRNELARGARDDKAGDSFAAAGPQPEAAEVESARLLAGKARDELLSRGLSDERIRRLADRYVAEDRGEDLDGFINWASRQPPDED
ncbi:MAG TPA: hypothetical protein VG709_08330 [Actinomycetota bacterium]|nr:hypothetical protein [Actinomycetota bacterium]